MTRDKGPYKRVFPLEALNFFEPDTADNPAAVAKWLLVELRNPGELDLDELRGLVTPENLEEGWGDFREAAERVFNCGIMLPVQPAEGDPDVVYVRYPMNVPQGAHRVRDGAEFTTLTVIATLVRRPSLGGWRVCHLGDYMPPELVPHD